MNRVYNNQIPKDAKFIIEQLENQGYEAYIVGGCVRDMIMQREPNDWDITTSAKPEQVKEVFNRTYDTGIQHGTVTVIVDEEHYEVTTYRIEGEYKDCRHPDSVSFVEDITLDLSRRDFTMNAIAYHPIRGFVDPYNGVEDIKSQCIRSVRASKERFGEDALRILRAVRFAAQIGFEIEPQTIEGIGACKGLLTNISKERIRDEFLKICLSSRPEYIDKLYELELLQYIVPELIQMYHTPQNHPHHIYNVKQHTIVAMKQVPPDPILRLAMLLHDVAKPVTRTTDEKGIDHFYNHDLKGEVMTKDILKDLRMDNQTINDVSKLVKYHSVHLRYKLTRIKIKELLGVLGEGLFDLLLQVNEADARAKNPEKLEKELKKIRDAQVIKASIIENKECYSMKQLAINGKDLMALGYEKGIVIGETLNQVLNYVIQVPEANTQAQLLDYVKTLKNNG